MEEENPSLGKKSTSCFGNKEMNTAACPELPSQRDQQTSSSIYAIVLA